MAYEELMKAIENSTQADWLHDDVRGVWTYKHDLMIQIREDKDEDEDEEQDGRIFNEKWVQKFPDKAAYKVTFAIYYGDSLVHEVVGVSVDGHRTIIPLPKSAKELVITRWQYRFGKIVEIYSSGPYSLDARLEYVGIRVA